MGETVKFPSNGHTCEGYLALPAERAPAVVVIQEWWGGASFPTSTSDLRLS